MRLVLFILSLCISDVIWADNQNVQRGQEVFQSHCARCHLPLEMEVRIRTNWSGRSASELLEKIKVTMPAEQPGSRSDAEYLDVTAYVLNVGKVTLPDGEVKASQLADITIEPADVTTEVAAGNVNWTEFNGNLAATRYSPLDQINAGNVGKLKVVWRFNAGIFGPMPEFKNVSSPVVVDGTLYALAGETRNVIALDALSGQLKWMWRPQEGERFNQAPRKGSGRSVAYWRDGAQERVFIVTPGYYLVALNAATGLPDPNFGAGGWVDLKQGLRLAVDREDVDIGLNMPPLIVDDVIIVGAAHSVSFRPPSKSNVKGDVRGFDARTGKLLWTFHTIPEKGEPGYETWLNGSAEYTGNAGVWAPMSADPNLGLVYLPVESATGDRYGGDRPGANLFADSVVALDIKTGKMRWYYQIIHHDIWDWDNPNAPVLADLPNGKKLVVQLTKQSFAYVFDRVTGEPVWPIEERPVPQTDVPGEWTSPTQPIPTKPAPYDRQGITEDDLIDFTPALRAAAIKAIKPYRTGPVFSPPSLQNAPDGTKGTLNLPSATGGTNWEGGAYDPETGILYVPSYTEPTILAVVEGGKSSSVRFVAGGGRTPRVNGLPVVKPPWGRITAIDLNSGEHLWWIPNADTPKDIAENPALKSINIGRTGSPTRSGLLLTKTLLFAGEGWGGTPVFRAYDKKTGKILAEIELPATQAGEPITYTVGDKQYIAMFVGTGKAPAELVVLGLP